jgi:hypothetical protein
MFQFKLVFTECTITRNIRSAFLLYSVILRLAIKIKNQNQKIRSALILFIVTVILKLKLRFYIYLNLIILHSPKSFIKKGVWELVLS